MSDPRSESNRKKLVVLDLDNTLISAIKLSNTLCMNKIICWTLDNYYIIYPRPYLRYFFRNIVNKYRVAIWSAGTKEYVNFVVNRILKPNFFNSIKNDKTDFTELEFVWNLDNCNESKKLYGIEKSLEYIINNAKDIKKDEIIMIDDLLQFEASFGKNIIFAPRY